MHKNILKMGVSKIIASKYLFMPMRGLLRASVRRRGVQGGGKRPRKKQHSHSIAARFVGPQRLSEQKACSGLTRCLNYPFRQLMNHQDSQ